MSNLHINNNYYTYFYNIHMYWCLQEVVKDERTDRASVPELHGYEQGERDQHHPLASRDAQDGQNSASGIPCVESKLYIAVIFLFL